jgi:predicted ABC-type ATPase
MKKFNSYFLALLVLISPFALQAEQAILFSQEQLTTQLREYSEEQKEAIERDFDLVEEVCFWHKHPPTNRKPVYLASAGAPGARKTTILETILHQEPEFSSTVYLDPDQRALRWMVHTYYEQTLTAYNTKCSESYPMLQREAYNKWRGASNYITNSLLEKALRDNYDIAHGTTMTGEHVGRLLDKVKQQGYHIVLALCGAEDETRSRAILYRNEVQGFYQTDPKDVRDKGEFFPQRMPLYFEKVDELRIYWSDNFDEPEHLGAILKDGKVTILNKEGYIHFVNKYKRDRASLKEKNGISLPSWNELIKKWKEKQPT